MRSSVCATEVMVVGAPADDVDVRCGGAPMVPVSEEPAGGLTISPDASKGTQIGKRYVNGAGDLELLCTKPGDGSVAVGDELLALKSAKPLPSSD
jgi:hypothetical protein